MNNMKKLLILTIVLMMASAAYALPEIDFGGGQTLKIGYEGQIGFTYRDTGGGIDGTDPASEINFRRNRINFIGSYNSWLNYYFQTEYINQKKIGNFYVSPSDSGKNFDVLDAQVRLDFHNSFHVWLGKIKHNLTRENLEACFEPLTFDRSLFVYTPFKTSRDIGVALWGNVLSDKLQYRVDVMSGQTGTGGDPDPSGYRYTGRLQASIFDAENAYGVAGTYLGNKQVLTIGAAYQYEPSAVYGSIDNVNKIYGDESDYMAYSFDIFYEQPIGMGAVTISAAYLDISFDDAYLNPTASVNSYGLNGQKNGWYAKAGYLLPFDVGPGMLQVFGRYDAFTFADFYNDRTDTSFYNQEVNRMAFGFNWYYDAQNLKVTAEYSITDFADEDPNDPNYQDFSGFELYMQVRI
jgi:hypothetical protein